MNSLVIKKVLKPVILATTAAVATGEVAITISIHLKEGIVGTDNMYIYLLKQII